MKGQATSDEKVFADTNFQEHRGEVVVVGVAGKRGFDNLFCSGPNFGELLLFQVAQLLLAPDWKIGTGRFRQQEGPR